MGFDISENGKFFYFIDDTKTISKLRKQEDRKMLTEECTLYLKDKDMAHLKLDGHFQMMIISDKYLIYRQMIFYLYQEAPHEPGIFEVEKLTISRQ